MTPPSGGCSLDVQVSIRANYPAGTSTGVEVRTLQFSPVPARRRIELGLRTEIAQGFGIVVPDMINARHIFRGLKRGIYDGSDFDQGPNKLIYSWAPKEDYVWRGHPYTGRTEKIQPPKGKVFVVIISPHPVDSVAGLVERWSWVDEDKELTEAPLKYKERYDELVWSKN
jgi:hypothetical protein